MYTFAEKLRLIGLFVFIFGFLCLPFPITNPKAIQSVFAIFMSLGLIVKASTLVKIGALTMLSGLTIFAASFLIKK